MIERLTAAVAALGALSLLTVGLCFLRSHKRLRSTDLEAGADPVEPHDQMIELQV